MAQQPVDPNDDEAEFGYDDDNDDDDLIARSPVPLIQSPDDYLDYYDDDDGAAAAEAEQDGAGSDDYYYYERDQIRRNPEMDRMMEAYPSDDIDEEERLFLEQQYGSMYGGYARAPYSSPYH